MKDIRENFANIGNLYYGHGIGGRNNKTVESIFKNGLRFSHGTLEHTTMYLGIGSHTLFDESKAMLDNWTHLNSEQIIIVSIPKKYEMHYLDPHYRHDAYHVEITENEAEQLKVAPGKYLRPEFIKGVYDTKMKSLRINDKYYENLSVEEQQLMDGVKEQYIKTLKEAKISLSGYKNAMKEAGMEIPITDEELGQLQEYDEEDPLFSRKESFKEEKAILLEGADIEDGELSWDDDTKSIHRAKSNLFIESIQKQCATDEEFAEYAENEGISNIISEQDLEWN